MQACPSTSVQIRGQLHTHYAQMLQDQAAASVRSYYIHAFAMMSFMQLLGIKVRYATFPCLGSS